MTAVDQSAGFVPPVRHSLWHRLYHGETTYDFVGKRRRGFIFSGVLILITIVSLLTRDLNMGIDFEGGVAWEVEASGELTTDRAESILADNGIVVGDAKIQTLSGPNGDRIRVQVGDQPTDVQTAVRAALAEAAGIADPQEVSVTSVSPTWGDQITAKARTALIAFFVLIAIYISIRFEWRMAVAALVAVLHDVLVSIGVYSVFGFEVTPATVIAFLTILGFSLYDTIVVFDKVHENTRRLITSKSTYNDVVNLSMNQVLMRSINTSIAAVLPVLSLLIVGSWMMGALALQDFALALLVGLLAGSYSSIFIATPILALLKTAGTKAKSTTLPRRSAPAAAPATRSRARTVEEGEVVEPVAAATTVVRPATLTHAPRPRKKRRR